VQEERYEGWKFEVGGWKFEVGGPRNSFEDKENWEAAYRVGVEECGRGEGRAPIYDGHALFY
jgi:hypothetical protein